MAGESLRAEFRRRVRERVLEAAYVHTVDHGWERVRVGEVAVESGVSRPTLYREFGNKDGLGEALMNREAERFFAAIDTELHGDHPRTGEAVAAASRLVVAEAETNPLLRTVLTGSRAGDAGLLPFLTSRSESIREGAQALLTAWLAEREPSIDPATVDEAVDAVVRLVISHVVAPAVDPVEVGERMSRLVEKFVSV